MQTDQLRALLAIVDHGTFDAAARRLNITPSAISQRIKALEASVGALVVRRTTPARATEAGAVLLRMARQLAVLEADARQELELTSSTGGDLPIAVNADSLATWFVPVLRTVADWPDTVLRMFVEDQGHSSRLLRSGSVLGAVTSDPVAVQGCSVIRLGAMRYRPMAAARLLDRFGGPGAIDWARLPVVRFNDKDDLQHEILADQAPGAEPPVHLVPSSQGFLAAVEAGLGWGMVPQIQLGSSPEGIGRHADDDRLVLLAPAGYVDVPLYWQVWRLRSPRIERITAAIQQAAAGLQHPHP